MKKTRTYKPKLFALAVPLVIFVFNCSAGKKLSFNYLGSYDISSNLEFQDTKIGGLSGIDYNAINNTYYLVSDDRSVTNPARFYVADINITKDGIDSVAFLKPVLCLDNNEEFLKAQTSDFESVRYNPKQDVLFLADEGGKKGKAAIKIMDTTGRFIKDFRLDASYLKNIRPNKSFESISFSNDFKSFFYATEAPLIEDGKVPSLDNGGLIRIIETDLGGDLKKQFLYELEKVPFEATTQPPWEGTGSDNGLSEIVSLGQNQFLTLERSGAYQKNGTFKFTCKVFFVKAKKARSDTKIYKTLKKEVVDFSQCPDGMFNIEGMTLGPMINGKQAVVFVSDNNFKDQIPTMIYLFVITHK